MKKLTFALALLGGMALSSCTVYCEDDYDCPEDCWCVDGICEPIPDDSEYYEPDYDED